MYHIYYHRPVMIGTDAMYVENSITTQCRHNEILGYYKIHNLGTITIKYTISAQSRLL